MGKYISACGGAAFASDYLAAGNMIDWFKKLVDSPGVLSAQRDSKRITAKGVLRELLLLALALGAYYGVRLLVQDSGLEPLANAAALLRFESALGLDWERALQQAFLSHLHPAVHLLNFVYAWGYWVMLAGSLVYLYLRRRDVYRTLRNAIIVSGLIGFFVFASFPAAPPRLVPMGVLDTAYLGHSTLEEVTRPSALTNQTAAMPSFHFGWILLCSVCVRMTLKGRASKMLVLGLPLVMGLTIIVTGNHYVIDAVVGGALCLLALLPFTLQRRRPERRPPEFQKV